MKRRILWSWVGGLLAALPAGGSLRADPLTFVDPAPPAVYPRDSRLPAASQPNPDAIFHTPPKPLAVGAVTSDWTCFLGPTHNLQSPETKLRHAFPPGEPRLVWEMKKGAGYSAPVVAGERLILFHRLGDQETVDCLDARDGRRYWRYAYPTAYRDRYGYNPGPRASPVIADGMVFTYGVEGKLHALDLMTGQVRWRRDLLQEFQRKQNFFGVGDTPLVEGEKLILNLGAPGGPCVAAFDIHTGKLVWGAGTEWGPGYATPVPANLNGKRQVLVFAGGESMPPTGGLLCLDPQQGTILGRYSWRGKAYESVNASAPVVIGNQVFVSECYGSGGAMVAIGEDGNCTAVWTNRNFGMHFMTPAYRDGCLYGADGHGPGNALVGIEAKTGRELWRARPQWTETLTDERGEKRTVTFGLSRCSLLPVDGGTLCLSEYGHLLWVDLSPQGYRELARARLFTAPETWTAPVLSRGLLYICQNQNDPYGGTGPRLLCYDLRAD